MVKGKVEAKDVDEKDLVVKAVVENAPFDETKIPGTSQEMMVTSKVQSKTFWLEPNAGTVWSLGITVEIVL